jgi:excisionase family DNA binding protein
MPEPVFYTVEEAAVLLRVGRTTAYRLVKLFVTSGGADGIPAVVIGGQYRVPRVRLEALAGGAVRVARAEEADQQTARVVPLHPA